MSKRAKKGANTAMKREGTAGRAAAGASAAPKNMRKHVIPRPNILHSYLDHQQINQYLDYLANRYGHFVKLHNLGHSHERRELRGIEIDWMNADNMELPAQQRMRSSPLNTTDDNEAHSPPTMGSCIMDGDRGRNIVFIEAGTHAREWITVTTALNCIYQLTERYTRNVEVLRKLRFFIVPLVNPDGYEYSRIKNRQWRKNRRPHKQTKFVGTDCNRNYDIYWESGPTRAHRVTYKGEKPFSEPETRAVRNILEKLKTNLLFFLSLHSYGQSIMYPWAYSREPIECHRELNLLACVGRAAIKSYNGREYRTGSISGLTKRTIAGSVVDYVYGVLKTPMALVMELPSQSLGFQPPVEMISQIGHESWFGIREMCKRAFDLRGQIHPDTQRPLPLPTLVTERRVSGGGDDVAFAKKPKPADHIPHHISGRGDETKVTPTKKTKRRIKKTKSTNDGKMPSLVKRSTATNSRLSGGSKKKSTSAKRRPNDDANRAASAPIAIVSPGLRKKVEIPPTRLKTATTSKTTETSDTATTASVTDTAAAAIDTPDAADSNDGPRLRVLSELKALSAFISSKY